MSGPDIFSEFNESKIALFIFDPLMRRHTAATLKHLGFENITDHDVPRNYFEAINRLAPLIASDFETIILNLPPKKTQAVKKDDVDPVFEQLDAAYADLRANLGKRSDNPLKLLSKTVPILEVADYLREKLIDVLFRYRVPAAFFLSATVPTRHLSGARKAAQQRENFQVHFQELGNYIGQYFRDKDELVAMADEKISEKDLSERKKQYDDLMAEAAGFKEKGDFESAIALLKQAIAVFPADIDAYLESGRLYVRRREYGRALVRYGQAEDLFVEAPEPNKEIAGMRLAQAKEKIEAGAAPDDPAVMELLNEAVANYDEAHEKAVDMVKKHSGDPNFEQPVAVGQEILKWDAAEFLGPKHPMVRKLLGVAQKSTEGLAQQDLASLTTSQALALGLQALERGDIPQAQMYHFHALRDKARFTEVCTEINYMGIRLRNRGHVDDALRVYLRLLKHKPHNAGSIYWNMAIAYAHKQDQLNAAGYVVRAIYVDPYLAREDEFYQSLTPQLIPIVLRLMRSIRLVVVQSKKAAPPIQLVKLYQALELLIRRINEKKQGEALKLFLKLASHPSRFTRKPEFFADGVILEFLQGPCAALAKCDDPKRRAMSKSIQTWFKWVQEHPVQPRLGRYFTLARKSMQALEVQNDQQLSAFYFGQALLIMPEAYAARPDFFAHEALPNLARELARKFKYLDSKRFPKWKPESGRKKK